MQHTDTNRTIAYLVIFIGLILAGFTSPLLKLLAGYGMGSYATAFYRFLIGAVALWPFILCNGTYRRELGGVGRQDALLMIANGCMLALDSFFWTVALHYSPVFIMSAITNLGPVWVILAAYLFLREKTPLRALWGVSICLMGVTVTALSGMTDAANHPLGMVITVFCSVLNAMCTVCNRHLRAKFSLWTLLCMSFTFGAVLMGLLCVGTGTPFGPYPLPAFAIVAVVSIACTLLRQAANVWALKHLPAATVSLMGLLLTYISGAIAYLLLGEVPTWGTIVGALITTAGLLLYFRMREAAEKPLAPSSGPQPPAQQGGSRPGA